MGDSVNDSTLFQEEKELDATSFEDTVNSAINEMEKGEDGKWIVPDDLPPEVKYAVNSERRRRDTQSSLSKAEQELKTKDTQNKGLEELIKSNVALNLTVEQKEELADLKENDPEAWRKKLHDYETTANKELDEEIKSISTSSGKTAEIESRAQVLKTFIKDNPEFPINDEVLENDIPPRITKKLEDGKITFLEFLNEAKVYVTAGKTTVTEDLDEAPDLTKTGGSSTVPKDQIDKNMKDSYKNEIY